MGERRKRTIITIFLSSGEEIGLSILIRFFIFIILEKSLASCDASLDTHPGDYP
jgi:hypothetical protein